MMAQLGVTLYLPAMPDIVQALSVSEAQGYSSLLMYLGGAAVPLILATHLIRLFGRSAVLLGFCCVFFSGSVLSLWAYDDKSFYLSRLLQGVGGGGAALIGRALLSETFSGANLAKSLSLLSYSFVFALVVGQVAGGYLVSFFRWEAIAVIIALGSIITIILVLPVRGALSVMDVDSRQQTNRLGYAWIIRQPCFYLPVIIGGCGYGVFIVCQGVGVYVFDEILGWGTVEYGMLGVWLGIAYFLGALSVRYGLRLLSIYSLSVVGICVLVVAASVFLLTTLKYLDRYFVVVAYFAVWYAQAMIYPCVASMAVKDYPGLESMMLFSFLQQLVALLFGALALLVISYGMLGVALLAVGLGGVGALVTILMLIKKNRHGRLG
jgi:predicted MFS family arabinose efflux permease